MKKLIALLITIALASTAASSQDFGLELGGGIATSKMDDMKYLQENLMSYLTFEGKILTSFPAYASTSIGIVKQWFPNIRIGIGFDRTSTGGRANYSDYSGSNSINMLAVSNQIGASVYFAFLQSDWYDLSLYGKLGVNLNKMDITQTLNLVYGSDRTILRYNAINPCGSVGLEYLVHLNLISIGVSGGYHVDLPGDLKSKDTGNTLKDPEPPGTRVLNADWTGWRAGAKLIYWFGR